MGGTSWRRAFCTSLPRDSSDSPFTDKGTQTQTPNPNPSRSPRSRIKFGFLSSSSNPSTPRFQSSSPTLRCRTTPPETKDADIKTPHTSNPCSPKSPSRFSLFKTSLRLSKSSCGLCLQNVKTGQGTAIFTAECSHAFHFPCIAGHVNKFGGLVCPVCNANWREAPLLAIHNTPKPKPKPKPIERKSPRDSKPTDQQRLYDDDEPLLSPRFNPISEAGENGEDDDDEEEEEEFQGFFVNPNLSIDSDYHVPRDTRKVDVKLLPQAAVISVGRTHETYAVVLKVKAPAPSQNSKTAKLLDPGRRAAIDLVTVLDVSGTMSEAKLQMLKRAMRLVISSLGSADRLSIIAFNSSPKRLLALRRMTCQGQRSARRIIDRLVCTQGGGASGVGEALRKATKVLEDRRERNPVASVMLLSDGQGQDDDGGTHRGRRPYADVSKSSSSTRFAHLEIPVSHAPAEDAFAKCVGGLLSVVVQDLRLKLGFCSGSTPVEIVGVYSCDGRPTSLGSGSGLVRLGDLYAEEERELLVELRVPLPLGSTDPVGVHHVMAVICSYRDPSSQETINCREESLLVPRSRDVRSLDPKIERLRNLFVSNRAIAEARRCIEHNELSTAHRMLTSARALIKQCSSSSSSNSVDEYIGVLDIELMELNHRRHYQRQQTFPSQVTIQRQRTSDRDLSAYLDDNGEPLTPTSAWRAAEKLAKVAIMRKSMNKVGDLHGFENARF